MRIKEPATILFGALLALCAAVQTAQEPVTKLTCVVLAFMTLMMWMREVGAW